MGGKDLTTDTPLYKDMYICTKFLGCSHEEFISLPRFEKKKLRHFLDIKMLKRQHQMEKEELEPDA